MEFSCPQSGQDSCASIEPQDSPGAVLQVRVGADFWVPGSGSLGSPQDTHLCRMPLSGGPDRGVRVALGVPSFPTHASPGQCHPPNGSHVSQVNLITSPFPQTPQTKRQTKPGPSSGLSLFQEQYDPRLGLHGPWSFSRLCGQPERPACPSSLPGSPASCTVGRLHVLFPPLSCCSPASLPAALHSHPCPVGSDPTRATHRPAPSVWLLWPRLLCGTGGVFARSLSRRGAVSSTGRRPGRPFAPRCARTQ